jgi:hypothetical protein
VLADATEQATVTAADRVMIFNVFEAFISFPLI